MVAITFEADIVSEYLRIPHFDQLKNKHVRIVIEADEPTITATRHLSLLEIDKNNPNFGYEAGVGWVAGCLATQHNRLNYVGLHS